MADEPTNDSTQTTETTAANPAPDSSTSTTEASQQPEGTLLGGDPAPEEQAQPNTDEPDPAAAFYGAPEADYELALPEGVEVDRDALAAVAPVAKELNLSNEGLSRIAGVYAEQVLPKVVEKVTGDLQRDIAATHAQWASEAKELIGSDPVFEGQQLVDVQQTSAKALDRFFGPEFRAYLNETGLGNHPAMLKGMYQVGRAISEDTTFERGSTAPAPKARTEKYYGSST